MAVLFKPKASLWIIGALLGMVLISAIRPNIPLWIISRVIGVFKERATVKQRVQEVGPQARVRLRPYFEQAGFSYPPRRVLLLGLKQEKRLELYASGGEEGPWRFVRVWPILKASGQAGPKLREGDYQVPEGFYRIESLNPNSRFLLSLRVNYPNDFDRRQAKRGDRTHLGGDIMIHGGRSSIGCLAMGDPVAEELFILAHETGLDNLRVMLTPVDFRRHPDWEPPSGLPDWTGELYGRLREAVSKLPRP